MGVSNFDFNRHFITWNAENPRNFHASKGFKKVLDFVNVTILCWLSLLVSICPICTVFLQGDFLGSLETSPETTLDNPRNVWGIANHSGLPIVILGTRSLAPFQPPSTHLNLTILTRLLENQYTFWMPSSLQQWLTWKVPCKRLLVSAGFLGPREHPWVSCPVTKTTWFPQHGCCLGIGVPRSDYHRGQWSCAACALVRPARNFGNPGPGGGKPIFK